MKTPTFCAASALLGALLLSGPALAADTADAAKQAAPAKQEQIYGSQLMTPQERREQRAKMRSAKTAEEREKVRLEHHEAMQARAREKGVTLPEAPPARGGGMGPGGGGMGPGGGGMGPGGMRNANP